MTIGNYREIYSDHLPLASYLNSIDHTFSPPLSERLLIKSNVNTIEEYSRKLIRLAEIKVCDIDGVIAGIIVFYANDTLNKVSYIPILSVNEMYKGLGIAKALIGECLKHLESQKFKHVNVETWVENSAALHLYQKSGFLIKSRSDYNVKLSMQLTN